jgi:hypothetical protein
MPKFIVKYTFELEAPRNLFFVAGEIVEGVIQIGMFVRIPLNSGLDIKLRIHNIEFARRDGGEDVCLGIKTDPNLFQTLRAMKIGNETLEITKDDSN